MSHEPSLDELFDEVERLRGVVAAGKPRDLMGPADKHSDYYGSISLIASEERLPLVRCECGNLFRRHTVEDTICGRCEDRREARRTR